MFAAAALFIAVPVSNDREEGAKSYNRRARAVCVGGCLAVDAWNYIVVSPKPLTGMIADASVGVVMDTANGAVQAGQVASMQIAELEENIEPYILQAIPDNLSVERRCQMEGYRFVWEPYSSSPFQVDLTSIGYVP